MIKLNIQVLTDLRQQCTDLLELIEPMLNNTKQNFLVSLIMK